MPHREKRDCFCCLFFAECVCVIFFLKCSSSGKEEWLIFSAAHHLWLRFLLRQWKLLCTRTRFFFYYSEKKKKHPPRKGEKIEYCSPESFFFFRELRREFHYAQMQLGHQSAHRAFVMYLVPGMLNLRFVPANFGKENPQVNNNKKIDSHEHRLVLCR